MLSNVRRTLVKLEGDFLHEHPVRGTCPLTSSALTPNPILYCCVNQDRGRIQKHLELIKMEKLKKFRLDRTLVGLSSLILITWDRGKDLGLRRRPIIATW